MANDDNDKSSIPIHKYKDAFPIKQLPVFAVVRFKRVEMTGLHSSAEKSGYKQKLDRRGLVACPVHFDMRSWLEHFIASQPHRTCGY